MPDQTPMGVRTPLWYLKFLMACWAFGVGGAILVSLVIMPFTGVETAFDRVAFSGAPLIIAVVSAPFVWRRLR